MSQAPRVVRLGLDEAGLGPTLGPLVIGGLATRTPSEPRVREPIDDLRGALALAVGPAGTRDGRIEVGDSKKIHAGARKLARIELSALATVGWVHGRVPETVAELLGMVDEPRWEQPQDRRAPWWADLDEALPVACERAVVEDAAERLTTAARQVEVEALWYRADVISAGRINRELGAEARRQGTKNTWATHAVLRLAGRAFESLHADAGADALSVWCDKAGGRQAYREPLERAFELQAAADMPLFDSAAGLTTVIERRDRSHYRFGLGQRRVDLGFIMKGDRLDPRISWGSILAKYLRELVMRGFNRHFAAHVPDLRATAGYPEDARRFIAQTTDALGDEGVPERDAWIRDK